MGCLLVALAEAFDATLLTMDERLARAHGPTCRIDVLGVAVIVVGLARTRKDLPRCRLQEPLLASEVM
jgi:predicted nucleic acid-binding protein